MLADYAASAIPIIQVWNTAMPTRNVVLTDRHEKVIADLVGSGRYQNASEVPRDGLRLIEEREAEETAKLVALREAASLGFADIDNGRYIRVAFDDIAATIAALGRRASEITRHDVPEA
jgi:antitoxin ParD1/3/4